MRRRVRTWIRKCDSKGVARAVDRAGESRKASCGRRKTVGRAIAHEAEGEESYWRMETIILSIVSLIVALGALIFSFYTYFAHDRELKRQEKLINDFQLSALEREEAELKKAQIRGNIIPTSSKGGRELRIYNSGKANAYNVRVVWTNSDDESTFLLEDISNLGTLSPHNPRTFPISLNYGHYKTMNLRYIWDDEYQANNIFEENLQL